MQYIALILITVCSRLLPHLPNMTAAGSVGLFSGSRYPVRYALLVVLVSMFLSDAVIGFHSLMWATYLSMGISVLLGRHIGATPSWKRIVGLSFLSSLQFFVITNAAVWLITPLYPKNPAGLASCFLMAIPFFRNSLIGDAAFAGILFLSSGLIARWSLRTVKRTIQPGRSYGTAHHPFL